MFEIVKFNLGRLTPLQLFIFLLLNLSVEPLYGGVSTVMGHNFNISINHVFQFNAFDQLSILNFDAHQVRRRCLSEEILLVVKANLAASVFLRRLVVECKVDALKRIILLIEIYLR